MHSFDVRLVLTRELAAIKLNKPDGSAGALYRIPAQSRIRSLRASDMDGMVEIEWQDETYAVFEQDLEARSTTANAESGVLNLIAQSPALIPAVPDSAAALTTRRFRSPRPAGTRESEYTAYKARWRH